MRRKVRFIGCHLAEKQAESRDGESYAHQAQPGTNPCQEGALGSQVNAGISFGVIWHFLKYTPSIFRRAAEALTPSRLSESPRPAR